MTGTIEGDIILVMNCENASRNGCATGATLLQNDKRTEHPWRQRHTETKQRYKFTDVNTDLKC